ncbi:hypothetical protein N9996_04695 [Synechococcus sp. AH-603-M21]|nr:hypothetical protein [Synechococcus sp. AH-603-M21]
MECPAAAAPLIYPTQPVKVVALLNRWSSASKENRGNRLRWLSYWLALLLPSLKPQAQRWVDETRARFTQW